MDKATPIETVDKPDELPPATNASNNNADESFPPLISDEAEVAPPLSAEPSKPTSPVNPTPSVPRTCVNFLCKADRQAAIFVPAYGFVLNHFNVSAKAAGVVQYVCTVCHDAVLQQFGQLCAAFVDGQPLIVQPMPARPDLVEVIDSSDEEDNADDAKPSGDDSTRSIAQQPLAADVLKMIEKELDQTLCDAFENVNFGNQVQWTQQSLHQRIVRNAKQSDAMWKEMRELQLFADRMHSSLYRTVSHVTKELPPWDDSVKTYGPDYPASGPIEYPPVTTTGEYYAVRFKVMSAWVECSVLEVIEPTRQLDRSYRVRYDRTKGLQHKTISGKHLAYGSPPTTRLTIGKRVIALFHQEGITKSKFYPGIVAEPMQGYNRWRYLIFFDDGYAQYVKHDNVRLVVETSPCVWDDVHADSATFIQHYLQLYTNERPMVQVKTGQRMPTEWQGNWLQARVHAVDASLVQMMFDEGRRLEWIYRGSTRLSPLFFSKQKPHSAGLAKRNEPYVNYTSNENYQPSHPSNAAPLVAPSTSRAVPGPTPKPVSSAKAAPSETVAPPPAGPPGPSKNAAAIAAAAAAAGPVTRRGNTAKKSTASPSPTQAVSAPAPQRASAIPPARRPTVQHMNNSTIYVDSCTTGKTVYYTAKRHMPPRRYEPHSCNPSCLFELKNDLRTYSPLSKPLLSGWERPISKMKTKKQVGYRAPCGRRLRNMSELHRYLTMTQCDLNVDNFDFDIDINCLAEYVLEKTTVQIADLSNKQEYMAVACVNHHDSTLPPPCTYSAVRIETEGVTINTDDEFLCGCDCEDDCLDKSKCQCWQLTLDGARFANPNVDPATVGYKFKRLPEAVPTGIYECNSRCKCKSTCLNRVAQQPLQLKLQVYKTDNRGWGLRCLNDMPKGCFVCVYAGDLLTEQSANEAGDNFGDEYFAELDYIEVVENLKAGYEPDVVNDPDFDKDDEDEEPQRDEEGDDSDDEEFVAKQQQLTNMNARQTRYNTRTRRPKGGDETAPKKSQASASKSTTTNAAIDEDDDDDDDANERQRISFEPDANSQRLGDEHSPKKHRSVRKFYGENESVYIMDAKKTGNIGRYFNHSCNPNLFVQNVFVDTHDLRFPWVAFYAVRFIPNGEELTWNYNYDVGSVPGKVLFCECRAPNCRGRLL